jgi:hypothetical protein
MNHETLPAQGPVDVTVSHEADDLFADYPKYTTGRIGWGTLLQIVEWQDRHGIGDVSAETVQAYREEGYGAAQAGLMLGLIDYGQASGCEDY